MDFSQENELKNAKQLIIFENKTLNHNLKYSLIIFLTASAFFLLTTNTAKTSSIIIKMIIFLGVILTNSFYYIEYLKHLKRIRKLTDILENEPIKTAFKNIPYFKSNLSFIHLTSYLSHSFFLIYTINQFIKIIN